MTYAAAIIAAALCALAYSLGRATGERRGRALGWLERNDQAMDAESRRRAADGTFRSVRGEVRHG